MTPQLAWTIRTVFGHSINPHGGPFSCVRLKELALRADTLRAELQELDDELRDMAEPPTPPVEPPPMGKIVLRHSPARVRAFAALRLLRLGKDVEVDCIEVLDELLTELGLGSATVVVSHKGAMTLEMAHRLRFQRGFDIRPNEPAPEENEKPAGHAAPGSEG